MQTDDAPVTHADATLLAALTGDRPAPPLEERLRAFWRWSCAWKGGTALLQKS